MKASRFAFAFSLLAAASFSAHADCTYPKPPDAAPNGGTATEAEMIAGMQAFKKYNAEVTTYLSCLDTEMQKQTAAAGDNADQVKQIKEMNVKKHNAAVDELTAHADEFNQQLRAYKAKQKG